MKSIILVLVVLAALFLISQSWAPNKSFKMRGIGSTALRRPLFAGKGFGGGSKSPESLMIDKVRDMIAENPSDDSLYFNLGLLFVQQGVPDAALDAFEKSVSLNPGRDGSWYNIGLLYEERVDENSLERALEAYDKAIEMTEREDISVGSFNNKVAVLLAMQPPMLDQAALVSDAAVKRHPNSPACWCSMGVVRAYIELCYGLSLYAMVIYRGLLSSVAFFIVFYNMTRNILLIITIFQPRNQ